MTRILVIATIAFMGGFIYKLLTQYGIQVEGQYLDAAGLGLIAAIWIPRIQRVIIAALEY